MQHPLAVHPLHPALLGRVAAGGALGALARHGLGLAFPVDVASFPWPTFATNLLGTIVLAALPAAPVVRRSAGLSVFLGPGVLGGFTTLSAYSEETRTLLAAGETTTAAVYVVGTLIACLVAVALADRLDRRAEPL